MRTALAKAAITAAIAGSAALALATPALAAGAPTLYPVPMTATVGQAVTISGLHPIAFPSGVPGSTVTTVESYSIQSNDPNGYTVQVMDTGSPSGLNASVGGPIPDSDITVQDVGNGPEPLVTLTTGLQTVFSNGSSINNLTDNWSLAIPVNQAPGNYTGQVTYAITGN